MSELVTLGKKTCRICGRKDCNNPDWPSWGSLQCYMEAYAREKARADAAEAERNTFARQLSEAGDDLAAARREVERLRESEENSAEINTHWTDTLEALAAARRALRFILATSEVPEKARMLAESALAAPADGEEGKHG